MQHPHFHLTTPQGGMTMRVFMYLYMGLCVHTCQESVLRACPVVLVDFASETKTPFLFIYSAASVYLQQSSTSSPP